MSPFRLLLLSLLLLLPTHASAHAGHGWDGLSHAWQHAAGVLDPMLAVTAVGLLVLSFRLGLLDGARPQRQRWTALGLVGVAIGLLAGLVFG